MHESRAYLLDKAGFYSEALNLYLEVFLDNYHFYIYFLKILKALFQKAIKKLENEKYFGKFNKFSKNSIKTQIWSYFK